PRQRLTGLDDGNGDARSALREGKHTMAYMEMEFPADPHEERVRSARNINDLERWLSLAAGTGLTVYGLTRRRPAPAGLMAAAAGGMLLERGLRGYCRLYNALGLNTAGTGQETKYALSGSRGAHVEESVVINRPVEELYRFWRNMENLPQFMHHLESVERLTDTLSRWRARGPAGTSVEWNAEIINEVPNKLIGWRSIEGSDVVSAGSVHFEDIGRGRGTRVRVRLQYSPPGGNVGATVARLLGRDAATEIREDLSRFKQLVETGEAPSTREPERSES
ncbi:MAG TPA: SRPBCC family protein, partial [Vicinamibacterales bacterium]|nr:SRPBCC family protein [Vicinamibacterales bacterium]